MVIDTNNKAPFPVVEQPSFSLSRALTILVLINSFFKAK